MDFWESSQLLPPCGPVTPGRSLIQRSLRSPNEHGGAVKYFLNMPYDMGVTGAVSWLQACTPQVNAHWSSWDDVSWASRPFVRVTVSKGAALITVPSWCFCFLRCSLHVASQGNV